MRNFTQQTDRIRDKTLMTRAIKEVKQGMFIQPPPLGLNELFYFFLLNVNIKSYKYYLYLKVIY